MPGLGEVLGIAVRGVRRAPLAVGLLVGFFVFLLGLIVGFSALAVVAISHDWPGATLIGGCALLAIVATFTSVRALIRGVPPEPGVLLTRTRQPQLWQVIDELAEVAGTRGPDELLLTPEVNAGVEEDGSLLGLRPGVRRMYIGAPLLIGLTVSELRALLGHELGHYSQRHTASAATAYRGIYAIERTIDRVDSSIPHLLLAGWFRLYLLVAMAMAVARQHELAADAISVQVAGKAAAQSVLRKTAALDAFFDRYVEAYLSLATVVKRTPDVMGGFQALLAVPSRRAEFDQFAANPGEEENSRFDTHPLLTVRLAQVGRLPDSETPPDDRPATALLADQDAELVELQRQFFEQPDDDGTPADPSGSWPEIVAESFAVTVPKQATMFAVRVEAAAQVGRATLEAILGLVEAGRGAELLPPADDASDHVDGDDDQGDVQSNDHSQAIAAALRLAIGAAALSTARARYALNWSGPATPFMDGHPSDIERAVDNAVADPNQTQQLRERLRSLGIPLDYRPQAQALPRSGEILGVAGEIAVGHRAHDVVVLGDGILLLRRPLFRFAGVGQRRRVARLAASPVQKLRARRHSRFVSLDSITHVDTREGLLGERMLIHLNDGAVLRLRPTSATVDHGGLEALGSLLP